jgi:hypothetical protein
VSGSTRCDAKSVEYSLEGGGLLESSGSKLAAGRVPVCGGWSPDALEQGEAAADEDRLPWEPDGDVGTGGELDIVGCSETKSDESVDAGLDETRFSRAA